MPGARLSALGCAGVVPPAGGGPGQRPAQRLCALSGDSRPPLLRGRAGAQLTWFLPVACIPLDRQWPLHPGQERGWRRGEWGLGIRWGVPRPVRASGSPPHPSSRPHGDCPVRLARMQGCSEPALLHACALLGAGSQPPPWCRVEPQQEAPERAPGSGQALRRGSHREPARAPGCLQSASAPGFGSNEACTGSLFRRVSVPLAPGTLHWFSNQVRRLAIPVLDPSARAPKRGWVSSPAPPLRKGW